MSSQVVLKPAASPRIGHAVGSRRLYSSRASRIHRVISPVIIKASSPCTSAPRPRAEIKFSSTRQKLFRLVRRQSKHRARPCAEYVRHSISIAVDGHAAGEPRASWMQKLAGRVTSYQFATSRSLSTRCGTRRLIRGPART